jgi:rRNA maturation endonuclease Nob1
MSGTIHRSKTRNLQWSVGDTGNGNMSDQHALLCLMMDIRDELQKLNRVFECKNFLAVPTRLAEISINTTNIAKQTRRPRYKQCPRCLENQMHKGECRSCGKKLVRK